MEGAKKTFSSFVTKLSRVRVHSLLIGKTKTFPKFLLSACPMRVGFSHAHFKSYAYSGKIQKIAFIGMIGLVYGFVTVLVKYKCEGGILFNLGLISL